MELTAASTRARDRPACRRLDTAAARAAWAGFVAFAIACGPETEDRARARAASGGGGRAPAEPGAAVEADGASARGGAAGGATRADAAGTPGPVAAADGPSPSSRDAGAIRLAADVRIPDSMPAADARPSEPVAPVAPPSGPASRKHRVVISSDIDGSDADDYQSAVHVMHYANAVDLEGLIASPPNGRAAGWLAVIDAYAKDYPKLKARSPGYPEPDALRALVRQGATKEGLGPANDGSRWIVQRARAADPRPLWVLAWGGTTDLAIALRDDPSIKSKVRAHTGGYWNTEQDPSSRDYIHASHADLWWIESNETKKGMYGAGDRSGDLGNDTFPAQHIRGHGALGDFYMSKRAELKMGDTPYFLYLLWGDADDPTKEHWGGQFVKSHRGPRTWVDRPDNPRDTVGKWRAAFLRDWQTRLEWAR